MKRLLIFVMVFFTAGIEVSHGQIKYRKNIHESAFVTSYAHTFGPQKDSQWGFSIGTGNKSTEIGLAYVAATVFDGEFNDQKSRVTGYIPYFCLYENSIGRSNIIFSITAAYLMLKGKDFTIPYKHVVMSPAISYNFVHIPYISNLSLIPEVGLSKTLVWGDGKSPAAILSERLTAMVRMGVASVFVTGEYSQSGSHTSQGVYVGIVVD